MRSESIHSLAICLRDFIFDYYYIMHKDFLIFDVSITLPYSDDEEASGCDSDSDFEGGFDSEDEDDEEFSLSLDLEIKSDADVFSSVVVFSDSFSSLSDEFCLFSAPFTSGFDVVTDSGD
jgi:hypothetical protein